MMIAVDSLRFRHPGAETDALMDITMSVPKGGLCCLLGVNGSGKSTLLAVLAGLFAPDGGKAQVAGCELPREDFKLRGKVSLVPQDPDVYILGSLVQEDLLLGISESDEAGKKRAMDFAAAFGLGHALEQPVHTLSYGQKRKLCLASALAADPVLLLLDEPFAGLDHPATEAMRETLQRNKQAGLTQVVVGHDLDLMADLADMFILMRQGRIVSQGSCEDVFPNLLAAGVRPPCWWLTGSTKPAWL